MPCDRKQTHKCVYKVKNKCLNIEKNVFQKHLKAFLKNILDT